MRFDVDEIHPIKRKKRYKSYKKGYKRKYKKVKI